MQKCAVSAREYWQQQGVKLHTFEITKNDEVKLSQHCDEVVVVVLSRILRNMCLEAYGPAYVGIDVMKRLCKIFWHPNLAKEIECIADKCKIFTKDNAKTGFNLIPGTSPLATTSGE